MLQNCTFLLLFNALKKCVIQLIVFSKTTSSRPVYFLSLVIQNHSCMMIYDYDHSQTSNQNTQKKNTSKITKNSKHIQHTLGDLTGRRRRRIVRTKGAKRVVGQLLYSISHMCRVMCVCVCNVCVFMLCVFVYMNERAKNNWLFGYMTFHRSHKNTTYQKKKNLKQNITQGELVYLFVCW